MCVSRKAESSDGDYWTERAAASDTAYWDDRSALDPLAAAIDPNDASGRKNAYVHALHLKALLGVGAFKDEERVLDFGCGTGRLITEVARRARHVTGIEISDGMAARASVLLAAVPNCEIVVYNGERLPFAAESFDVVITAMTMQMYRETPSKFRLLGRELRRVLHSSGRALMLERVSPGKAGPWALESWREGLAEAGLQLVGTRAVRTAAPSRLGAAILAGAVPRPLMAPALALEAELQRRKGFVAPYTEALLLATPVEAL